MKRKIVPIGIAGIFTGVFLFLVLFTKGCAFNLLPYMLHERMTTTGAGESTFVEGFDVVFAILMFWLVYLLIRWLMQNEDQGVK
jgi:hypothetical protein